jgi:hypothetical protein
MGAFQKKADDGKEALRFSFIRLNRLPKMIIFGV